MEGGQEPAALVDAFIEAYNAKDFEALSRLLGESVHLVHYGRDIDMTGRTEVLGMFQRSAQGAFPERRFHSRRRRIVDGDHVVIEQVWEAQATIDVPNMAHAGEVVRLDLCTVFTVRDSRVVAYDEYG